MKNVFLILTFVLLSCLNAQEQINDNNETIILNDSVLTVNNTMINKLLKEKEALEKELIENNSWLKIYSNYHTYNEVKTQSLFLEQEIKKLTRLKSLTPKQEDKLEQLKENKKILLGKLELLKEYSKDPFTKFLTPPSIGMIPKIENPFSIIGALSYNEKLQSDTYEYESRYNSLVQLLDKFKEKLAILHEILAIDINNIRYLEELEDTKIRIKTFEPVLEIFETSINVYTKKIEEIKLNLKTEVKREMERTMIIGGVILFFIILLVLIKYFVKRYMSDNDRFYSINKALNITFISISILTLLFAYIENVSYLVTILGFASAGIAIAMKDWFMSLLGWVTIVMGGTVHVGDRVRFVRDGISYVGDIVDISMLRMTMHEDVTLTTILHNRRAGRMIFIPNNFIFTDMISNYSHAGLKTVWDGIDFMITFDSNIHKASLIAKEVTRKYSKGYTDITRKQLNKLRSQYSIKNTNVEPRILTFIEPYGMKISAWYLTNAYATLTLRSTISAEIISRIQAEEDIFLAFPTHSVYMEKESQKRMPSKETLEEGL